MLLRNKLKTINLRVLPLTVLLLGGLACGQISRPKPDAYQRAGSKSRSPASKGKVEGGVIQPIDSAPASPSNPDAIAAPAQINNQQPASTPASRAKTMAVLIMPIDDGTQQPQQGRSNRATESKRAGPSRASRARPTTD